MGDRGNILVLDYWEPRGPGVFLYTHWGGSQLAGTLKDALSRRQRWDDSQYLARIIFDEMKGDDVEGENGYGISARMFDNSHFILVVDCQQGEVHVADPEHLTQGKETPVVQYLASMKFEDYISYTAESLQRWLDDLETPRIDNSLE